MEKNLAMTLSDFLKINGVKTVALVGRDGFVIESVSSVDVNIEALGAVVATAIGTSEMLGNEFDLGQMSQYLVEFDDGKVVIAAVGNDILAVFTDGTAIIGGVRYAVKKGIADVLTAQIS